MAQIKVGKADIKPDASAHQAGVSQGNAGRFDSQVGHLPDGRSTAERSTGVNPKHANPIDPRVFARTSGLGRLPIRSFLPPSARRRRLIRAAGCSRRRNAS